MFVQPSRVSYPLATALMMGAFGCAGTAAPLARAPRTEAASVSSVRAPRAEAMAVLRGTWVVSLSPEEARVVQILRLAFAPGDTQDSLLALRPTQGERDLYNTVVSLLQGFDPRAEELEQRLKDADLVVTVSEDQVAFAHAGEVRGKVATFWVESEQGKELTVRLREGDEGPTSRLDITIVDDDTMLAKREGDPRPARLVRKH